MRQFLDAGNITRRAWPSRMSDNINLYLGSGRAGASFDAYGLMGNGFRKEPDSQGITSLMHAEHWHRGGHGIDSRVHALRVVFADGEPIAPTEYEQSLDLYDARMRTHFVNSEIRYDLATWFDPSKPDILAMDISYDCKTVMPDMMIHLETKLPASYGDTVEGRCDIISTSKQNSMMHLTVGTADSVIALRIIPVAGDAAIVQENGTHITFGKRGRALILIGMAAYARRDELSAVVSSIANPDEYAASSAEAWHKRFGNAGVLVPDKNYQAMWARSLYYVLASYAPDVRCPAPPCGWSGNMWRYAFPQDLSYIHPALLRLGHVDIVKAWVEFFHSFIDDMRKFTARIFKTKGIMWAWEFPIGNPSQLLDENAPGKPNWYQYEIHNAAYVARMAYDTSRYLNDAGWTRSIALPVITATAEFFESILTKEANGKWGIDFKPSMGQDELAGDNRKNYLCALFAAEYSLRTALRAVKEMNIDHPSLSRWQNIIADGINYDALYDENEKLCAIYEAPLSETLGKQKHPVQVNPLVFLPFERPHGHAVNAYHRRYDIVHKAKENTFYGWTLATFWAAASHMHDAEGLSETLSRILPSHYADDDLIQIYESSRHLSSMADPSPFLKNPWCYYVTSHGLFLQAVNDAFVCDYGGTTVLNGAVPEAWKDAHYQNLRTANGECLSGKARS